MKWKDITLWKFQQIETKNSQDIDEMDKTLFAVCFLFGYTEFELDRLPLGKVAAMIKKVERVFKTDFAVRVKKKAGKYRIEYNCEKLTFGQYVELSFFFTLPPVQAAHYIMASIGKKKGLKKSFPFYGVVDNEHSERAEYFLQQPVTNVMGCIKQFSENFLAFNKRFGVLFDKKEDETEVKADPFITRYGWVYSAKCVADYNNITVEQAYNLPAMHALNDLVYLKEKVSYDNKIIENGRKNNSSNGTS